MHVSNVRKNIFGARVIIHSNIVNPPVVENYLH